MATFEQLPVYKTSYDLLIELFKLVKNFSREWKFTIGEEIKKETIEMILNVYRANSPRWLWVAPRVLMQTAKTENKV